jgi:predicted SAM-dependent methyltransferase
MKRLNIGCCDHLLPGWINVDLKARPTLGVEFMDATQPFPFPDGSLLDA